MTRWFPLLILSVLFACAACTPANPLDWKISAETPNDLNDWIDKKAGLLPDDVRAELNHAIRLIQGDSGHGAIARTMYDTHNEVCMRLHRQTIRAAILDGYHVEKIFLLDRLARESEYLTANLKTAERFEDDPKRMERAKLLRDYQEKTVAEIKKRLAEVEARVAVLSANPN